MPTIERPLGMAEFGPYATLVKAEPDELVKIFQPNDINIVAAGR